MTDEHLSTLGFGGNGLAFNNIGMDSLVFNDTKATYNQLLDIYRQYPGYIRQLVANGVGTVIPLNWAEQKTSIDITTTDSEMEATFSSQLGMNNQDMVTKTINVPIGYNSISMQFRDPTEFNQTVAGQNKLSQYNLRAYMAMAVKEDIIATNIGVPPNGSDKGVLGLGVDLGSPTGAWGVASSGLLTNVIADFKKAMNSFTSHRIFDPIDVVITTPIKNLLDFAFAEARDTNMRQLITQTLNGGQIIVSDLIQDKDTAVASDSNTVAFFARNPQTLRFAISEQFAKPLGAVGWSTSYGIAEQIAVHILPESGVSDKCPYILFMDGIDTATS